MNPVTVIDETHILNQGIYELEEISDFSLEGLGVCRSQDPIVQSFLSESGWEIAEMPGVLRHGQSYVYARIKPSAISEPVTLDSFQFFVVERLK